MKETKANGKSPAKAAAAPAGGGTGAAAAATPGTPSTMAERKRILKVQSEFEEEGRRVFVYERAKTGEVFTIADQQLDLDDMEKTQHDVALLLQHGLNTPAENEAADAEAEGGGETAPMDFSNNKETDEDSAADIDSPDSETPAESETDAVEEPAAT